MNFLQELNFYQFQKFEDQKINSQKANQFLTKMSLLQSDYVNLDYQRKSQRDFNQEVLRVLMKIKDQGLEEKEWNSVIKEQIMEINKILQSERVVVDEGEDEEN